MTSGYPLLLETWGNRSGHVPKLNTRGSIPVIGSTSPAGSLIPPNANPTPSHNPNGLSVRIVRSMLGSPSMPAVQTPLQLVHVPIAFRRRYGPPVHVDQTRTDVDFISPVGQVSHGVTVLVEQKVRQRDVVLKMQTV